MANQFKNEEVLGNFELDFSLDNPVATFVPFGVRGYAGLDENAALYFHYQLRGAIPDSLLFEIAGATGEVWYRYNFEKDEILLGSHQFSWDGFDDQGIYDSCRFNGHRVEARLTAILGGVVQTIRRSFYAEYKIANWLDLRIQRQSRIITATLRTNFTVAKNKDVKHNSAIPADVLKSIGKDPIYPISKTNDELLRMAMAGLGYHWGRNHLHAEGKFLNLEDHGRYEIYVQAENTDKNYIKSPKIVFQLNSRARRSRNWELSRLLFYGIGYLKNSGKWCYCNEKQADEEFKCVTAHEIGHEILLAYGGHLYSKTHKNSSTLLTQRPLGNYLYPPQGEVDLMLYYAAVKQPPFPQRIYARSVAAEADVKSLIWLNKLEIRALQ